MTKKSTVHKMAPRSFRENLKCGWSTEDFCKKYNCTEAEFHNQLSRMYGNSERELSKFRKKLKENSRNKRQAAEAVATDGVIELVEAEVTVTVDPTIDTMSLEDLRIHENVRSDEVIVLETEHKNLCTKHRACADKLREIDQRIDAVRNTIDQIMTDYEAVIADANTIEQRMDAVSAERRGKLEVLNQIRARITELSRISIGVHNTGEIEVEEGELALNDAGFEELYAQMKDDERYEMLRMRDIKTLARLTCIVENAGVDIDVIIFEDSELEAAYNGIQ